MNRRSAIALTFALAALANSTALALPDWDLERDFRLDAFPDPWRYQGALPGKSTLVDLIPVPPGIHFQDGSPVKDAWIAPGVIGGNEYGRAFIIQRETIHPIPANSLFVHPETDLDPVIVWTAPLDGTLSVTGRTATITCNSGPDGVRWSILVAGKVAWSAVLSSPEIRDFDLTVGIHAGETILFRENVRGHSFCDWGYLSAQIVYLSTDAQFQRGDAAPDGRLNVVDPVRVLQYLFTGDPLECLDAADADDNGTLNIGDAVGLLGFLFLGTLPPASPFATCGLDSSADELTCMSFSACP